VYWIDLTKRIAAASAASFSDLLAERRGEHFYAFVLYTDSDCYTVLPSANSMEKHREKVSKEAISDATSMAGYQWSIGEWAYEAWRSEGFEEICRDLSAASQAACEKGEFPEFKRQVHASMIQALASLDEMGFFGPIRNEIVIFISSTDGDESIELENGSAKMLNPPGMYEEFLNRFVIGEKGAA
jgi:hypothetical protein